MTNKELEAFCSGAAPVLKKHIDEGIAKSIAPLQATIAALETRLSEIEGGGLRYLGTHEDGKAYRPGDTLTHQGSLWVCRRVTTTAPGFEQGPDRAWSLAAKKGRDGKDARP